MKISVNWLKQFTDIDLSVDELVKKIGAQLGAVEEVEELGKKYQGIYVVKVIKCDQHPNADKLKVCVIDDGGKAEGVTRDENGHVQVVCGAPNVREGLTVAWIAPGSTVPSTFDKDPFVLEARELRGVVSNGMLASAAELALGDDHSGIAELDTPEPAGTGFADAYELNDYIIDIENKMFTHRPDCFGILGVAREVAGIQSIAFKSPEWYLNSLGRIKASSDELPLQVKNEAGELVPRFMAIAMADVKMGKSPFLIQTYLSRVGLKPINNIVDVTNYLMYLTGQPLHAYDYDKVKQRSGDIPTLVSRKARKGDKIALLNGKTLEFEEPAILIATDKEPIGVGGIMGGADTEVDDNTRNIILECANFDMYSIRRTAMRYGLFTDAVTRFNKGQSPLQNAIILEEAVATVQYVGGAHVASQVFDVKEELADNSPVKVTADFINVRLGLDLPAEDMAKLLENVEFEVEFHGDTLTVKSPFWRTDIEIAEDLVEEVGRLYGFDHLPLELPKRTITPAKRDEELQLKTRIREVLAKAGANEVLTYSFVHGDLIEKAGQDKEQAFKLSNALSPDLQYYRLSLTPSLLDKVHPNIKAGYDEFAIFEIGKSHNKGVMGDNGLPDEISTVELVYSSKQDKPGAAYYMALRYLDQLLDNLNIEYHIEPADELFHQIWLPFDPKRSGYIRAKNGGTLGVVGELRRDVQKSFKLPKRTAALTLALEPLGYLTQQAGQAYVPLSKYPKVEQDISLKVGKEQQYQPVFDELQTGLRELADKSLRTELKPLDIYEKDDAKHFTFRLTAAHYEKTLKAAEINELLDKMAERAKQKFNAERI